MIHRGVSRGAAALFIAAVAVAVSGCSLLAPAASRPTSTPTETPDPVPIAQQLPDLRVAGQTIATGQLQAVEHDPGDGMPVAPLTGAVRVVVDSSLRVKVHVRPDAPLPAGSADASRLHGYSLLVTNARRDGKPDPVQPMVFGLDSDLVTVTPDGELVLPIPPGFTSEGDPSYLHSIEETVGGSGVVAAAPLTWTLPSPFPKLQAVDHGPVSFARGKSIVEDGVLTGYVPNPYDTLFAVSRRFGLTEVELVWLNPALLFGSPEPQLKYDVAITLDPANR